MNILVPYLHQFPAMVRLCTFFGVNWYTFALNLVLISNKNYTETAPSNGAIWDEFIEQH